MPSSEKRVRTARLLQASPHSGTAKSGLARAPGGSVANNAHRHAGARRCQPASAHAELAARLRESERSQLSSCRADCRAPGTKLEPDPKTSRSLEKKKKKAPFSPDLARSWAGGQGSCLVQSPGPAFLAHARRPQLLLSPQSSGCGAAANSCVLSTRARAPQHFSVAATSTSTLGSAPGDIMCQSRGLRENTEQDFSGRGCGVEDALKKLPVSATGQQHTFQGAWQSVSCQPPI